MIVGKEHYLNLATMGDDAIEEYEALALELQKRWPFSTEGILEAEHGAVEGSKAGACVTHVHVHCLPGLSRYTRMFDGILPPLRINVDLADLTQISGPYIFTRGDLVGVNIYDGFGLHSQMIRRTLCEELTHRR